MTWYMGSGISIFFWDQDLIWNMGSAYFFGDQGSGFDMKYGISVFFWIRDQDLTWNMGSGISVCFGIRIWYEIWDQRIFWIRDQDLIWNLRSAYFLDQGSGFDMKYGIWDQRRNQDFSFGIGITAIKTFWERASEINKDLGSGIKFLVKTGSQLKKNTMSREPV